MTKWLSLPVKLEDRPKLSTDFVKLKSIKKNEAGEVEYTCKPEMFHKLNCNRGSRLQSSPILIFLLIASAVKLN